MNKKDVEKLAPGLYVIHWKPSQGGGTSQASVGIDAKGRRWFAAVNWTEVPSFNWHMVDFASPTTMGKDYAAVAESVGVYLTEKDADKRLNFLFIRMLEGLSKMLEVWGDAECKGGGCIEPREQLFHCRACVMNGIKGHVDQAIQNWNARWK